MTNIVSGRRPREIVAIWVAGMLMSLWSGPGTAAVTSDLQKTIRENTFEVVMKKPAEGSVAYEKPLPLELLPYIERNDAYRSVGTAFALGHNVYVTAGHVFEAAIGTQFGPPELRRADGKVFAVDRILKFSIHEDFVVFSLRDDPSPSGFATNRSPKLDEAVLAVGNALGEGIVIRDGLFTSETAEEQDGRWKWIRFSAAASPGNSGGPLCDDQGKVIGIVIGKSPNENLNFSFPIGRVLDAEDSKARFDQKMLVSLPYLHGTQTYAFKDEFKLPLSWPDFAEAFQKVTTRHAHESREQLFKSYAESLFPKGPGTEDVLFDPSGNGVEPRLVMQQADGTWSASAPRFHSIDLPADGSVSVSTEGNAWLVHLVRSGSATDDGFYQDSKSFMDLALKALDLRRSVGPDQVRVTSLGAAKSDTVFADQYGRKWQQRVWAVPYLDAYLVGMLLPAPDGYSGIVIVTPSIGIDVARQYSQLLAGQFDVSYRGTLPQWQAALKRHNLLPSALSGVKLDKSPIWTLQTSRLVSSVPADVLPLTDKSELNLTMGFIKDGAKTLWDIEDVRWDRDAAREAAVRVWRRESPPDTARIELRNRFENIREHRAPYDGTLNRDTMEVFSATSVILVPRPKPGMPAKDVQYGVTVYLVGHPTAYEVDRSIADLTAATRVLELGASEGTAGISAAHANVDQEFERMEANMSARAATLDAYAGRDVRNRLPSEDMHEFVQSVRKDVATAGAGADAPAFLEREKQRAAWLQSYWAQYPALTHNRDMWTQFLARNQLPSDTPHQAAVLDAERSLTQALAGPVGPEWATRADALRSSYIEERRYLVKHRSLQGGPQPILAARTDPCPPASTATSGGKMPGIARSGRSLDELWPVQSKRLGEQGSVMALVTISTTGCATHMTIAASSGSAMLDEAVLRYLESVEFVPAFVDGKATEKTVTLPIVFTLDDKSN